MLVYAVQTRSEQVFVAVADCNECLRLHVPWMNNPAPTVRGVLTTKWALCEPLRRSVALIHAPYRTAFLLRHAFVL